MSRERDVRNAVQTLLQATGQFDPNGVWLFSPEDQGEGTDATNACWIEPFASELSDPWDAQTGGGVIVSARLRITFASRADDPQKRDEAVELLFNAAANALDGQTLVAGFTLPAFTRFVSWTWLEPDAPERRIVSIFSYQYELEGWGGFDLSE